MAAGREWRTFRARTLRSGNGRGCFEPSELESSPPPVTAGRDVRRWCLPTASLLLSSPRSRFCICLIIKQSQFCSGDISPKQKHNTHINSYLQKRRSPKSGPGRTWHHRRTSRPAVTGDLRPGALGLPAGVPVADK